MTNSTKLTQAQADEERLAHALITRGLLTREECQQCKAGPEDTPGAKELLQRLVKAGALTVQQAKRASQELQQLIDQQIPGYQLLEKLGQGATGMVYRAVQLSMNRLVAIKILHPKLVANQDFLERFTREAQLAAKFSSNHVVQAIDVGSAGPLHYFVMELIDGTTLQAELSRGKVFAEREAVGIVMQVAQALRQAHARGLVHRDVKPANIVLTKEGVAKLADLGVAREMQDKALAQREKGITIGTPFYIPPEQIVGKEDVDIRSDIYSLGATLYHLVTGRPPFPGPAVDDVLQGHLKQELVPPDHINTTLSAGLGEVVEFMMAKNRKYRYQTPEELIPDLECLAAGQPPRLARQKLAAFGNQAYLAAGQADEPANDAEPGGLFERKFPILWFLCLLGILTLSLMVNVFFLMKLLLK